MDIRLSCRRPGTYRDRVPRPRTPRHALPSRIPAAIERLDNRLGDGAVRLVATAVCGLILLSAGVAAGVGPSKISVSQVRADRAVGISQEVRPAPVVLADLPAATHPAKPSKTPAAHKAHRQAQRSAKPAQRWLPTGTGMWLHEFGKSEGGNAQAVVARARAAGLTTLYVQTGSSKKGWIGGPVLTSLLRATKGTEIRIIAWDFPTLKNPEIDAKRMAAAAKFTCRGCARVAAVAPDVETAAEGTRLSGPAVHRYYTTLRERIGPNIAILATVPWPSEKRTRTYPYRQTAALSDALLPMAYWYNREPSVVTATSMRYLKQFKRPIMPVGQGYDGRLDAPYLAVDPAPGLSVLEFLRAAKAGGAKHISLWSWQTTGPQQWYSLKLARTMFPAQRHVGGRT